MSWKSAIRAFLLADAVLFANVSVAPPVSAQAQAVADYDLPAQPLADTLRSIAQTSGDEILFAPEAVDHRLAPAIKGRLRVEDAVRTALAGSSLLAERRAGALIVRPRTLSDRPSDTSAATGSNAPAWSGDIVITGTHVRGAPVASPIIRLGRDEIRDRGQATLAEAVRAIPQNFGGGQNPGVGNNVPAGNGVNVGGASSVNLRGLGSDATLTLVNGHRLSYSASRQAIDISSIPLEAVDRIEVVPDGASALYGSDAVAGVVNVLLRRDFRGIEASAHVGAATDGGDFQQRYGLAVGTTWRSGGIMAVYEFGRSTEIKGRDRSYTAARAPALTLFPSMRNHNALISAHQDLGNRWTVEFDGLFNQRHSASSYALNAAGNIALSGISSSFDSRSFVLAPTVRFRPGGDWRVFATGSYAKDTTRYDVKSFSAGSIFDFPNNCYCNYGASVEIGGDGTLFRGPAGPIKTAIGAGWRTNHLDRFNGQGASTNVAKTQQSYYAYGELSLPLISSDQHIGWVDSLSVSAAGRYERYPGIGEVVTPKVGAIFAPSPDFALKASWGKSFRAPTLYQQYQPLNSVVARLSAFGGTGFPAGSTGFYVQGGSPDLKPERATSWSTTLSVHPRLLGGVKLETTYFDTRYRDRVVTPILFVSQALSDPINAGRLTFNPPPAVLAELIAGSTSFANSSGAPFNPANVVVLVDNRNVNAGLQKIHGWDLAFDYDRPLGSGLGDLSARVNATLLKSAQQLTSSQPVVPLAGILFNPPHFFARGDLAWTKGILTINAGLTRIGSVKDARTAAAPRVHGMTTFDLTARVKSLASRSFLGGVDASVTVQNLFNAKPAVIATSLPSEAPYDSTNYSPVGRFVAATLIKKW